jgi:hypothetical protein
VAAAYHQDQIIATGSVDGGLVRWSPGTQPQRITRKITYTNTTDSAVTLTLSVDGADAPATTFTAGATRVTVPARGTSTVDVVVDPKGLAPGRYSARITARHAAGVVHTAVGVSVESKRYDLTIHLKDRTGRPASGEIEIVGADGASTFMWVKDGKLVSRWAPGTYALIGAVDVKGLHGDGSLGLAMLTVPELELTADRVVELDASKARQVKVATPQPTTITNSRIDIYRSFTSPEPVPGDTGALRTFWPGPTYDSLWALPTRGTVRQGSFLFSTRIRAEQTPLEITRNGRRTGDPLAQPGSRPLADGTSRLDAVFAGTGSTADYTGVSARGKAVVIRRDDDVPPSERVRAATAAGAALLLVVNDGLGRASEWYGNSDGETDGPLPVASLVAGEGEDLIAKVTAAGRSGVRLQVTAHPSSRYLYDLVDYHRGGIPADPSPRTDPRHLARIDLVFAPPPGKPAAESRTDFPPYLYAAAPSFRFQPVAPGPRTDWVSTGDGIRWKQYADVIWWGRSNTDEIAYRPGSVQKDRWFGPITRPRLLSYDIPFRGEFGMSAYIQGFGDAGTAHSGGAPMLQRISLYQGDRQLTQFENWPELFAGDLPAEKSPYRLTVETETKPEYSPYSSTTRTDWTFFSAAGPDVQAIPLAQLDYTVDVDLAGRAPRRSDLTITPVVVGSTAAKDGVSSLGLEVSYDDGRTWQRQSLKERKGAWTAALNAPGRAEYVSIRVTAAQRNGGGVTQTVMRAFGLR